MVDATYRVKEARIQLYSENGRHPDDKEVAEAAGLSMKRLSAVLLTPKAPRSLDQKMGFNMDLKLSVRNILSNVLLALQFLLKLLQSSLHLSACLVC
jgi:DNA-directed RNA polymerase sigma subunit (sigma70/sigma32)